MNKNEIKEITAIYRQIKDEVIAEHYFTDEEINSVIGKINDKIQLYIEIHKHRPQIIMVSKILEMFMINKINIMHHRQMIRLGDEYLEVSYVFGIPVLITPVLDGLEFEIY